MYQIPCVFNLIKEPVMGNEAATRISMEETAPAYVYETIETADTFAARIEHLTAAGINQLALVTIALFARVANKTSSTHTRASMTYFLDSLRSLVGKRDGGFRPTTPRHYWL